MLPECGVNSDVGFSLFLSHLPSCQDFDAFDELASRIARYYSTAILIKHEDKLNPKKRFPAIIQYMSVFPSSRFIVFGVSQRDVICPEMSEVVPTECRLG